MASVIKRIEKYNSGIPNDLHKIKWDAMAESPFRFYRATAFLFSEDFYKIYKFKPKVKTWICGDLHFENFGSFKGANRLVYFDLNDFDEAVLASPEPEITRFLTSLIIALAQLKTDSLNSNKLLHDVLNTYVNTILAGKAYMLEEEVAHGAFKKYFEQLSVRNWQDFISKKTVKHKGHLLLKIDNEHFYPLDNAIKNKVCDAINHLIETNVQFEHFVYVDSAFRLAGTGSVGLQRYAVLCFNKKKGKHYLFDVKEARKSCYSDLVETKQPRFFHEAERINNACYLMQFNSPAFMSSVFIDGKWFCVKELQSVADKMSLTDFEIDYKSFNEVADEMVKLLAYAHLRSSGNLGSSSVDELKKFVNKKQWQKDILTLSGDMAKRNYKYYKEFISQYQPDQQ